MAQWGVHLTYAIVLFAHSWIRWLVVALALALVGTSMWGWLRRRPWGLGHDRLHFSFILAVDLQLGLGLLLYLGVSPLTRAFLADPGGNLAVRDLRFFGLEHITMMLLAVGVAHVGRMLARRTDEDPRRHRAAAVAGVVFLLLVLVAVPWPFAMVARPWFRL